MNGNPFFSDLDPAGLAGLHTHDDATDIGAQRDAETGAAMILDSTAHQMELNNEQFQEFDDILTGNDTTVPAGGTGADVLKLNPDDLGNDSYIDGLIPEGWQGADFEGAAPQHMDTLTDGREVLVIGDTDKYSEFNHQQGDNDLGFKSDCGLCSSQDVLNQFGVNVTENDVVHHAVDNNECQVVPGDGSQSGGTTADWQAHVLSDYGVPAHVENGGSLDDLATNIQDGHGVIIEVNAGVLWDDPNSYGDGSANHAIAVTGVVRDPTTSEITGYIVNDSGDGKAEKYVDAATMQHMWIDTGGQSVVTDVTH